MRRGGKSLNHNGKARSSPDQAPPPVRPLAQAAPFGNAGRVPASRTSALVVLVILEGRASAHRATGGVGRRHVVPLRVLVQPAIPAARHEIDKLARNFGNEENPSAGYIAWLLWGGDEGRAWALELKTRIGNAPDI